MFKEHRALVAWLLGKTIKTLQYDRVGEFLVKEFKDGLREEGVPFLHSLHLVHFCTVVYLSGEFKLF